MATTKPPATKKASGWKGKAGPSRLADEPKGKPAEPLASLGEVASAKPSAAPTPPKLDTAPPPDPAAEGDKAKKKGRPPAAADAAPAPRTIPFDERPVSVHYLPVKLDKEALNVRAEQHVALLDDVDRKREERRKAVAAKSAEIKELQAKADKIRDTLRTGREEQPIECREVPDWQRKIVNLVRLDTQEVVNRRPMVEGELQIALTFPAAAAKDALSKIADKACTCDASKPGVHSIDCPTHGVK